MRPLIAGAFTAAVIMVWYFNAPLVPVALGTALACGWMWWRKHGRYRAH